jgi:hypothetical protein
MIPLSLRLVAMPVLLGGFLLRNRWRWMSRAWTVYASAIVLVFGLASARMVWRGIQSPPEWDFRALWLFGRVASRGGDLYDPDGMKRASAGLELSSSFEREIVDVGVWYPPTSMPLFLPLGWLELRPAYVGWMLLNGVALAIDVYLLWLVFFRRDGRAGLLLAAAVLALWPSSAQTVRYAQTNLLLLLPLVAGWRRMETGQSGVWIALASLVKPVAGALLLVPLVRQERRIVARAAATLAGAVLVSLALFGASAHYRYLTDPPSNRMPGSVYVEDINQSLLATLLRAMPGPLPDPPIRQPAFVCLGALLTVATVVIVRRLPSEKLPIASGLSLALGLLVYPATLAHYGLLLIVPVSWLWSVRGDARYGVVWAVTLASLVAGLLSRYETTFWAFLLTWMAFAVLGSIVRGDTLVASRRLDGAGSLREVAVGSR